MQASYSCHFVELVTDDCHEKATKGATLINAELDTKWTVKTSLSWDKQQNLHLPDDKAPLNLLESKDAKAVYKCMCLFVLEAHHANGQPYPPAMFCFLLYGLNRVLRSNKTPFLSFQQSSSTHCPLLNTMDNMSSNLHQEES